MIFLIYYDILPAHFISFRLMESFSVLFFAFEFVFNFRNFGKGRLVRMTCIRPFCIQASVENER